MHKSTGTKNVPCVYAFYTHGTGKGEDPLMVINRCIPVFADLESAEDFYESMIKGQYDTKVIIKKVILKEYDENNNHKSR